MVNFEPQGAALLRDGKVKEALASYRALIALNPECSGASFAGGQRAA